MAATTVLLAAAAAVAALFLALHAYAWWTVRNLPHEPFPVHHRSDVRHR